MQPSWRSSSLLAVFGAACGVPAGGGAGGDSSGSSGSADESPQAVPPDAGAPDDEAPERLGGLFLQEPDGGDWYGYECDPFAQDCPIGEKCNLWASEEEWFWDSTRCVPVVADPDDIGEPCDVEGDIYSGVDTCVRGAVCWDADAETGVGECVALCTGSEANPSCPYPDLHCVSARPFLVCLPSCCPLEQDCAEGLGCYPVVDSFWCAPDASGMDGEFGDTCEFINVCDPGLACVNPELVPGCEGASCCTRYCETELSDCGWLHPDLECVPWYDELQAPPGYEHVGICMLAE